MKEDFEKFDLPDLGGLETELKKLRVPAMTQNETARFYARLDTALDHVAMQPNWFNRVVMRWGAVGAAMVVLVGMSFVGGLRYGQTGLISTGDTTSAYTATVDQATEDEELDDKYVEMLVSSQVQSYGYDISDDLLGGLSDDELQMLNEKIDVGDLL